MNAVADQHTAEEIQAIFDAQRANQFVVGNSTIRERRAKLRALRKAVEVTYRQAIRDALYADMRKSQAETDLTEIYVVTSEIKHAISHLADWVLPHRVPTPLSLMGGSSRIKYEPKGVCLIISPWNFPVNLTLGPLVSAIAAGNTVIIKPSEMTPHTSAVIRKLIADVFPPNEVTVVEGAVETSTKLLDLPFNHIFFTGAPSIGKIVMEAASKHLASVTLELGGKSPTIVDETADINTAAGRLAWGKFSNCGQICIAPDYVLVHESKKEALAKALAAKLREYHGEDIRQSDSYNRIVNQRHTKRIVGYLEEAVNQGAKVPFGGESNLEQNYIEPTLVTDVPHDSDLMENEIFGPLLPLIPYRTTEEAIAYINSKEKPLALYIYSRSNRTIEQIINNTRAGGTCINHNAIHFYNSHLPFGGSNNSGIGKSHGFFGFQEFANARSIYRQHVPGALELLTPPYTSWKEKLIEWTVKFF